VEALLVVWGGVVVPACFGDEFAPAFGSMLFMDEWWWCRLWCDRASAALAKLSAATETMAIPRYLKIMFVPPTICSRIKLMLRKGSPKGLRYLL
jgi:hypothetical protein